MGRPADGESFALEAIAIHRNQEPLPRLHLANGLRVAALIKETAASGDEALRFWAEARDLYRRAGIEAGVTESELHIASIRSE